MKTTLLCLAILLSWSSVKALWCWRCINAKTNKDCNRIGRVQFCLPNENTCFNEIRRDGNGWSITKRCKQTHACNNNKMQNEKDAWKPTQCHVRSPISQCRCCCDFNGCNVEEFCKQNYDCAPLSTPLHGKKRCSFIGSYNDIGSVCQFKCDKGYEMLGPRRSTCMRRPHGQHPKYNNVEPRCVPKPCLPIRQPQHSIMRCTKGSKIGSVCTFECLNELEIPSPIPGRPPLIVPSEHHLRGPSAIRCNFLGSSSEWDAIPPVCDAVICPQLTVSDNVTMDCAYGNYEGSTCRFSCQEGHKLLGPSSTVCFHTIEDKGVWTSPVPICIRKRCATLPRRPNNGSFVCSDDKFLNSRCEFTCDEHHWLSGSKFTTCIDGESEETWSPAAPTCERVTCENQPLRDGHSTCTDSNYVHSVCSYSCNKGFELTPDFVTSAMCLADASWNISLPCCYRVCPPQAVVDVVMMIDSSSSIGRGNWGTIKSFVRNLINSFVVGDNAARVGVFRYNRKIDTNSQILLGDFPNDKPGLLKAFAKIPYDGSGTLTGQALRHARNVLLRQRNGDRPDAPDYILVITDGKSFDSISTIARQLHRDGVRIFVIGVLPPRGRLDFSQLNQLVMHPDDLVIARSGFRDLNTNLFRELTEIVCTPGCY